MSLQNGNGPDVNGQIVCSVLEHLQENPAMSGLGISKAYLRTDEKVEFVMPVHKKHTNIYGIVHGGVLATLFDTVMGYACHFKEPTGSVVTLNINCSFISNCAAGDTLKVVGHVVHAGRRVMVAEAEAYDQRKKLLANSQGTFFVKE